MTANPPSRDPCPIAIGTFFLFFFASLLVFVVYATRQKDDLVRADYYEQEMRFQEQVDRVDRTQKLREPAAFGAALRGEQERYIRGRRVRFLVEFWPNLRSLAKK